MKKILLIIAISMAAVVAKAQFAFNEVYARPGGSDDEFIEIFNNAKTNININTDCYSILTYWSKGSNWGWYVIDLGNNIIVPGGYFVAASDNPFDYQNGSNVSADFNWSAPSAGGSLQKYQYNGSGYTAVPVTDNKDVVEDVGGGMGFKNLVLIYKAGVFIQGLVTGTNSNTFSLDIANPPNLTSTNVGACTNTVFSFAGISGNTLTQFASAATGTNNGYSRLFDGNCAPWQKASSGAEHTPGLTNNNGGGGGVSPYDGTITTAQILQCDTKTSANIIYNIIGVIGAATVSNSLPTTVEIFTDLGTVGQYDPGVDVLLTTNSVTALNQGPFTYTVTGTGEPRVIILYTTANGCYDKVYSLVASCSTLPVNFLSFTATRSSSNVIVKWETASEQNNSGFAVERNINGTWEQVGFVPSQASNGNSVSALSYQFIDINNTKGITQYRIKQIDIDAKSKYSEIRSVRGDGQKGRTIIYPNPSSDGKVNIAFEGATTSRDVSVTDMSGRTVKQLKGVTANTISIDNLAPGMYSLRIVIPATGDQTVEKIVVNKR